MSDIYFLSSAEPPRAYKVRRVEVVGPVACGVRSDYVWARVMPPLEPNWVTTKETTEYVLLAPRHVGATIVEPPQWPVDVYVATHKSREQILAARVEPEDLWILYWGLLHRNLQDALASEAEFSSYDRT